MGPQAGLVCMSKSSSGSVFLFSRQRIEVNIFREMGFVVINTEYVFSPSTFKWIVDQSSFTVEFLLPVTVFVDLLFLILDLCTSSK